MILCVFFSFWLQMRLRVGRRCLGRWLSVAVLLISAGTRRADDVLPSPLFFLDRFPPLLGPRSRGGCSPWRWTFLNWLVAPFFDVAASALSPLLRDPGWTAS